MPKIEDEGDRIFSEYVSSTEFVAHYNALEEFNTNLNSNKTISDFESDEQTIVPYITKWLNPNRNLITNNNVDCDEQFENCNKQADQDFFSNMWDYQHQLNNPAIVATINAIYMNHLGFCMESFNDCLGI